MPTARNTALLRLAGLISLLGHPLVTTVAFVAFLTWHRQGAAAGPLGGVVAVVALISLWLWRQTRRGRYTNFDVSERGQRKSFYPVLLGVLGCVVLGLLWQQPPGAVHYGLLAVWSLLLLCYGLNFWLKVSLHAAISFFLAGIVASMYSEAGVVAVGLAVLVATSRLVLRRHTLAEVLVGGALGAAASGLFLWGL